MDNLQRIIGRIIKTLTGFGMAFLLVIMILTVINIISRPLGHSISGIIEISQLLIVITVSFAICYTALEDGHVVMSSVIERMPRSIQSYLNILSNILTICIWGMIAWYNFEFAWEKTLIREYSVIAKYPVYPFRYIFGLGCVILCITFIIQTIIAIRDIIVKD